MEDKYKGRLLDLESIPLHRYVCKVNKCIKGRKETWVIESNTLEDAKRIANYYFYSCPEVCVFPEKG